MPRTLLSALTAATLLITLAPTPAQAHTLTGAPTALRTDGKTDPLGTDLAPPQLSWRDTRTGHVAYQIQAATSPAKLAHPDLWDSGRVRGTDFSTRYAGRALTERTRVYWRVRTWTSRTTSTAWSAPAWFETGIKDWKAQWIGNRDWQLSTKPVTPVVVTMPKQTARFVRLDVSKLGLPLAEQPLDSKNRAVMTGTFPAPTYRLQLAELEVRDSATPDVNLAEGRGKNITVSETQTIRKEWEPALLADGTALGYQSAAHDTPDASIQVTLDLGAEKTFDRVVLQPRKDTLTAGGRTANFPVDYRIETATTDMWTTAATVRDQPTPEAWLPEALPVFQKRFETRSTIRTARLYVSGLGVYETKLNGRRVGDAVLEPGDVDYADQVPYAAYDVTKSLGRRNTLDIAVGNGTANALDHKGRYRKFAKQVSDPQVIAQLEITYTSGRRETIATDPIWKTALGPTTLSSWYGGEDYDARRENPATWENAVPAPARGPLTARIGEPVKIVERLPATRLENTVFDVGRNIAGFPEITLTAPAGTTIRVYPAESLNSGHVDQSISNVGAPIWDQFTSKGGTQTWHPRFTYHGFRYLEVAGLPEGATITVAGLRTMGDYDSAGTFDTDNDVLDGIHRLTRRAVEGNMQSILTDCPSREKLGWLEQDHLAFDAIARSYDVRPLMDKIVRDMVDAQESSGLVPSTVPDHTSLAGAYRDDPNWGGALVLVPWQTYLTYGDRDILERYYPAMQRYLAYLQGQTARWVNGVYDYSLGDWITTEKPAMPKAIPGSTGVWHIADGLSKIATVLGRETDAATYRTTADALASALWAKYYDPATGLFGGGGQGATALALDIKAVPDNARPGQLQHLIDAIEAKDNHLIMGEISFPSVLQVLSEAGRDDVIYQVATQTTSPSLGFQVKQGLTSLGETWDGGSGQSQNHFMLGALDAWMQRRITGIDQKPGSAGFRDLVIAPAVSGGPASASGSFLSPYGRIATAWTRTGDRIRLTVTVPPGATAEIRLPGLTRTVGTGTWTFTARSADA
ncbi:family 78 glycoside hydrolase catalytic domain [Actinoplanes missouriensis]|uniref:family 78 glycoside hydrolase catalytic domain n=1 Tax=Actinoplanes missouriensis TaxID=1866 RepID=UPI0033F3C23A